ncbi:MAG: DUF3786 domain-containing protein [Treponema sp.]|nr:DUF3786 domain-containing protein [Treponema sp.]
MNGPYNLPRDSQSAAPLRHYQRIYQGLDPLEIARRCSLEFDGGASAFKLRVLGTEHLAPYPVFSLVDPEGEAAADPFEKILFLRYLCEGKFFPPQGKRLSYNEFPWGEVYYPNFEGRCLRRFASVFGNNIPGFVKMAEHSPGLNAVPLGIGDASYRLEFINGLYVSIILWRADDEFPPSAQILFDDNFVFAFTAEDLAAVGEILTDRLKILAQRAAGERRPL